MAAKTQVFFCQLDFLKEINELSQILHEQDLQKLFMRTITTAIIKAYRLTIKLNACDEFYK